MKIAYFGYDFFAGCLKALIDEHMEICRVFSFETDNWFNYNQKIIELAKTQNLEVEMAKPTDQTIQQLKDQGCDLIFCAGYPHKIPPLESSGIKGLNVHPTLLPHGRGVWPLPWTILEQAKQTGVTFHKLNQQWDSGDIIHQQRINLEPREYLETLSCKVQMLAQQMVVQLLQDFDALWQQAKPQQEPSTYFPMPQLQDRLLDWGKSVEEIDRIARAFGKFDSLAKFDDQQWWVQDLKVWRQAHDYKPGQVVHRMNREIAIAAKDGIVCLRAWFLNKNK